MPFPQPAFPSDTTLINQAIMQQRIIDPLNELDGRVSSAPWGDGEISSNVSQGVGQNIWVKLGWSSPSAQVYGTGISAASGGLLVANPGRYLVTGAARISGNSGGVRRLIAIDTDTSSDPSQSPTFIQYPPAGGNIVPLSTTAKITVAAANTLLTVWVQHDVPTTTLQVTNRYLQCERIG